MDLPDHQMENETRDQFMDRLRAKAVQRTMPDNSNAINYIGWCFAGVLAIGVLYGILSI